MKFLQLMLLVCQSVSPGTAPKCASDKTVYINASVISRFEIVNYKLCDKWVDGYFDKDGVFFHEKFSGCEAKAENQLCYLFLKDSDLGEYIQVRDECRHVLADIND